MSVLYVLLDGAEDHPIPAFGGKKPLDVAHMPFMKSRVVSKGSTQGCEYTHIFLSHFFTGREPTHPRAVLEAVGLGLDVKGRTAYRLSPALIDDGMINWCYNAHEFSHLLIPAVERNMHRLDAYDPQIRFFLNGRAVITMDWDIVPELPAPPMPAPFVEVPGALGEMVMAVAEELDGITNYPWGCGRPGDIVKPHPQFRNLTAISDSPTPLGLCASFGFDFRLVEDIDDRFPLAREALGKGDVFLHMDEIDEYSHQKDPRKKVGVLEHIDKRMAEHFGDVERIVYIVDHGTSSVTGEHIACEVPFWTTFETPAHGRKISPSRLVPEIFKSVS
ncbi:MAG: phosphoglycerate mutase [Thermoplasmatales archaeon]|nr:phosphoglycerate mutase [Thermoplasmatales archaeon]